MAIIDTNFTVFFTAIRHTRIQLLQQQQQSSQLLFKVSLTNLKRSTDQISSHTTSLMGTPSSVVQPMQKIQVWQNSVVAGVSRISHKGPAERWKGKKQQQCNEIVNVCRGNFSAVVYVLMASAK